MICLTDQVCVQENAIIFIEESTVCDNNGCSKKKPVGSEIHLSNGSTYYIPKIAPKKLKEKIDSAQVNK